MKNLVLFYLIVSLIPILVSAAQTYAADFTGGVVRILDGDTIEVLHP